MVTVDSSLLSFIFSTFPRGSVFFAEDLEPSGFTPEQIRFALSRLVAGQYGLVRLGRGIYCRPLQDEHAKFVMPSVGTIAGALARRWRVRIAPCAEQAAFLSGLSGLSVRRNTFVSDGSDQTFNLSSGEVITFTKRKSQKVFQFRSEVLRNLSEGLRFIGEENIHTWERGVIADNIQKVSDEDFIHDVRLTPLWIRTLLREIRS